MSISRYYADRLTGLAGSSLIMIVISWAMISDQSSGTPKDVLQLEPGHYQVIYGDGHEGFLVKNEDGKRYYVRSHQILGHRFRAGSILRSPHRFAGRTPMVMNE